MFGHGANLDGELLAALATLFQAVTERAFRRFQGRLAANARQVIDPTIHHTAMRADDAVSPNDAFQMLESLGLVVEVGGRKNRHGDIDRKSVVKGKRVSIR